MSNENRTPLLRTHTHRDRPAFLARTATDDAAQLERRSSQKGGKKTARYGATSSTANEADRDAANPYEPLNESSSPQPRPHRLAGKLLGYFGAAHNESGQDTGPDSSASKSLTAQMIDHAAPTQIDESKAPKMGSLPRPVGGSDKLGTFSGVFVPTVLNVISILMFLRFGFILGQGGVLGIMGMLIAAFLINLITTLSISAIATNGTVRGGGAYYLISRSLGPEFGGSIGVVLYLGFVLNTGMNAVGLVDCFRQNFGAESGNWYNWLPESPEFNYLWATVILLICTGICLAGSGLFARASNGLLVILLLAIFSIPFSALVRSPFVDRRQGIEYTGISGMTFKENWMPRFTKGAAGSDSRRKPDFQNLFGILFPATGGIFAGASMSGDLKHPSKAIPKGTLSGLGLCFLAYTVVVFAMAATITRESLYDNVNVIQDINVSATLILLGEFASAFFSSLMGVIGSAKLLQALARDNLLPGFSIFGQGTSKADEPTYAIIFTHLITQVAMLFDVNQIASFITMTYLMTFLVTNLACFLLKIGSAPNFRPSFVFFNAWTAGVGTIVSGATMLFVDGQYASGCVGILILIFLLIHYTSPPKSWGDVSQSLIYHQVRKYLLRLRQEHVKFWRPQILLFINNPRHQYKLMKFCNSMKKGSLYILGHVIVTEDFGSAVPEARRQQAAWTKYIDVSRCKAFVNIVISPAVEWGTRNIIQTAGLGGMRPNIAVLGFYNLPDYRDSNREDVPLPQETNENSSSRTKLMNGKSGRPLPRSDSVNVKLAGQLPTDTCRTEGAVSIRSYVTILEDLLLRVQINVALARGFKDLEFPDPGGDNSKKYIDLWPIQMSAVVASASEHQPNVLTTNFDTYTLILQLGCILNTVPAWKKAFKLRIAVFVEFESDVEEEKKRVQTLLTNLRINADIHVFWLASGKLAMYESIVNGKNGSAGSAGMAKIDQALVKEEWWEEIKTLRGWQGNPATPGQNADLGNLPSGLNVLEPEEQQERFHGIRKLLKRSKRRHTMQGITKLGVNLGMTTQNLEPHIVEQHAAQASASEDSDSSSSSSDEDTLSGSYPRSNDAASFASGSNRAKDKSPEPTFPSMRGLFKRKKSSLSQTSSIRADQPSAPQQTTTSQLASGPIPPTGPATLGDSGPSIVLTSSLAKDPSAADPPSQESSSSAAAASMPLSFNDLPCRAQHLILNELIRGESPDTAVLFTTLPAPLEGTCQSEEDSVRYLTDLETLCDGLPPTLLVHSNSMTVTTNL